MSRTSARTVLFAAMVLAMSAAAADEGRIPIFRPTTIDTAGHYLLTRNISATAGPVIQIRADGVVVDLGGNTVALSDTASPAVLVDLSGVAAPKQGVAIRNGRIEGGSNGIQVDGFAPGIALNGLRISSAAAYGVRWDVGSASTERVELEMEDSGVIDALGGLLLADPRPSPLCAIAIVGNLFGDILGDGVVLEGCPDGKIADNEIIGFGKDGNPASGIELTGGVTGLTPVVVSNTVTRGGAQAVGMTIGGSVSNLDFLLASNAVTHNGGAGIVIQGGSGRIASNDVSSNGGDGIRVEGGSSILVEANYASGNDPYGIYFGNTLSHAYRDNYLRNNKTGTVGGEINTDAGGNIE